MSKEQSLPAIPIGVLPEHIRDIIERRYGKHVDLRYEALNDYSLMRIICLEETGKDCWPMLHKQQQAIYEAYRILGVKK